MTPRLSVVIPTRDRGEVLRDCLVTLQAQDAPESLELLVVDDGSAVELAPLVASVHGPLSLRCVRQAPAGLNVARDTGVRETSAGLIAFLDDDTLVSPGWARAVIAAFETEPCAAIGGRVTLRFSGPPPRWLRAPQRSYLAELDLGEAPRWLDPTLVPVGANCAVRREVFERVGGFHGGLDRSGTSLVSNGDTEFFRRLLRTGGRVLYVPAAAVQHRVPPERLTVEFITRRARAQGISDVRLEQVEGECHAFPLRLAREVARLGRAGPILVLGLARGRGTMNARQWLNYCRGRLSAIVARSGNQGARAIR